MLAANYAAQVQPPGLTKLVIANSLASLELGVEGRNAVVRQMPEDVLEALTAYEEDERMQADDVEDAVRKAQAGESFDPKYQPFVDCHMAYRGAMSQIWSKHACRVPWPVCFLESMKEMSKDSTVHDAM